VHIELIVNDAFDPEPDGVVSECAHCENCFRSCPTRALTIEGKAMRYCLRNSLFSQDMPEDFWPHIRQFLGCERCQRVCPKNSGIEPVPILPLEREALSPDTILTGSLEAAKELIGSNLARRNRLTRQALLFIGANRLFRYRELLESWPAGLPEYELHWALWRLIDGQERI
jgi:epoxyqueuosine reductase QueG